MRIFISIASYRDPELTKTIEHCLSRARWPESLRFGVCQQRGPEEAPLARRQDPRFRVIDVDWRKSGGACWARAEVMRLYDGEEYFMQIDSHMRFAPNWDEVALRDLELTGSPKPLLTNYPPQYHFATETQPERYDDSPTMIAFRYFDPDGLVVQASQFIEDWKSRTRPMRARFLGACFLLTDGGFVEKVPYDPELYFIGEEISLAVRAFTRGYDLFHPHEIVCWHHYPTGKQRRRHWDDHDRKNGVDVDWWVRDRASRMRVRKLLTVPRLGKYAMGTERRVADYEAYSGLDFKWMRAQSYTEQNLEPPNPPAPENWAALEDAKERQAKTVRPPPEPRAWWQPPRTLAAPCRPTGTRAPRDPGRWWSFGR